MYRFFTIALILMLALYVGCQTVFAAPLAIAQPDGVVLYRADAYKGVIQSGDVLFVAAFEVQYDSCELSTPICPAEDIGAAFLGHVIDDDGGGTCALGTAHFASVAPAESTAAGFNGYNRGLFSYYVTAEAAQAGTPDAIRIDSVCHALEIAGNPSLFASPPSASAVVVWHSKAAFPSAFTDRVEEIEDDWDLALLDDGKLRLDGEAYFEAAIPNLRSIAPQFFTDTVIVPNVPRSDFTNQTGYRDNLLTFWDADGDPNTLPTGASFEAQFDLLESEYNIPELIWKMLFTLLVVGAAIWGVSKATGNFTVGMLAFPIAFPVMTLMGMAALEIIAIMTFLACMWLGYMFLLKGAN